MRRSRLKCSLAVRLNAFSESTIARRVTFAMNDSGNVGAM